MQGKEFAELKDNEIAILVNALRDTALRYHDHQSLRERIAHLVVPALKGEGLPKEARIKDAAESRPMASDTVKACIRTVFLKNGFTIKDGETDLKQYVYDAALELIASLGYRATPPAYWWINGQEDPHGEHYAVGVERSTLTLGDLTDDELANGLFLNYDRKLSMEELTGGAIAPIGWATAAKERIRWLSRSLTEAISRLNHKTVMLGIAHEKLEALRAQYIRDGQASDRRYADLQKQRVLIIEKNKINEYDDLTPDDIENAKNLHAQGILPVAEALRRVRTLGYEEGMLAGKNTPTSSEVERPDVDPIQHVSNDGQTGAN